ncbi:MAG: peptidoglycan DD-metalloendopeptidase family protein [Thermoanaerobaculia bacterium]
MSKYNTIIFVPHTRARFRKITVSSRLLALTAASASLVLVASIAFGWALLASNGRDREYRQALADNARLRTDTTELKQKLTGLSHQLDDFDSLTNRLAIVAGLAPWKPSGVGGPGPTSPESASGEGLSGRSREIGDRLSEIEGQFAKRSAIISSTPTVQPVRGAYMSGFGDRQDPFSGGYAVHQGVDIATDRGEPVSATGGGIVLKADWSGDLGNMVEITHPSGYRTIYGHLDKILVRPGQKVERGDRVGLAGATGRATGPHLHYEVRLGDRPVNPLEYILDAR